MMHSLWIWWGRWEMLNNWNIHPLILWKVFFSLRIYRDHWRVDYKITDTYIQIGMEASYIEDYSRYIVINKKIGNSYYFQGIARGFYGTSICGTKKYYRDYKYNGKMKRLMKRMHELLYPEIIIKPVFDYGVSVFPGSSSRILPSPQ